MLLAVPALCTSSLARAHGGRPQTQTILWDATGDRIVGVSTFGLLVSEDAGASWSWTCQESIPDAVSGVTSPAVLASGDRLLLASVYGLLRGERAGCGWAHEDALADRYVADVVQAPGGTIYAVSGDSGVENRLFTSDADGLRFTPVGAPLRRGFLPERLRVAPGDASTMYVVGQAFVEGTTSVLGIVLRSDDAGATWSEHTIALEIGERVVRGLAVDPADPRVLYVVVQGSEHDRLLRSADGGAGWELVLRLESDPMPFARPFSLELAPDGAAYFGNTREGLFARRADGAVDLIDKYVALTCLHARGATMWMCGDGLEDGFAIARFATDAAYEPETVLRFADITQRTCASEIDCQCAPWWDDFLREVMRADEAGDGGPGCPDAGVRSGDSGASLDASSAADGGPGAPPEGCGCRATTRAD
nr:hypothetical protein [Myxococcota bacterium]